MLASYLDEDTIIYLGFGGGGADDVPGGQRGC